jgi:hypothetical protein
MLEITTILRLNRVYDSAWSFGKKMDFIKIREID